MRWILLGLAALLLLWLVFTYNTLVALRARVAQAFGDIDVQLKQRRDLIPNLVEAVKGYAGHERATLEAVVEARNAAAGARGPAEAAASEAALQGALGRLMALGEAYPDLKASTNFQSLQDQLAEIENALAAARRFFNNAVAEYNAAIAGIPGLLIAGPLGLRPQAGFDLGEPDRKALDAPPSVRF